MKIHSKKILLVGNISGWSVICKQTDGKLSGKKSREGCRLKSVVHCEAKHEWLKSKT